VVAVIADRVRDVSITSGLSAFTLAGTPNMLYKTFANVCVVGDTCPYVIQHRSADEWEVGIGTYTALNTLARTRVISSSTGSLVFFSAGEKDVILGSGAHTEAHRFNVPISPVSTPTITSPGYVLNGVMFVDKFGTAIRLRDASGTARITINPAVVDLTVPVALPSDPVQALHAVTKQYVDGKFAVPSDAFPVMNGSATPGVATTYARGDHVHPSDTTKAAVAHTHTASQVTDFSEAVDDRVSSLLSAGSNITLAYNDASNVLVISAAGSTGAPPADALSTTFTPAGNISSANVQAALEELDAEKVAVAGFPEAVDDRVASLLQAGTNVTLSYNDVANTLTINSSGGGTGTVKLTCSDTPPLLPTANDLWWKTNTGGLYVYYFDGTSTQWVQTGTISSDGGGGGGSRVTSSDTPPLDPVADDLWWKTNTGAMYIYFDDGTSSQWVQTSGGSGVFISDNPPPFPVDGMMWWKSNTGVTYLRYNDGSSTQWVAMHGAT
jgi:hypothetical protein